MPKQLADSLLLRNRFANALEHYLICFEALYNASQEINRNFIFSVNDESDMILLRTRASIALNVATCLRAVGRFSQAVEVAKDVKNDLTLINTGASHSTMHDTSRDDTDHNTHINVLHELNDLKKMASTKTTSPFQLGVWRIWVILTQQWGTLLQRNSIMRTLWE